MIPFVLEHSAHRLLFVAKYIHTKEQQNISPMCT